MEFLKIGNNFDGQKLGQKNDRRGHKHAGDHPQGSKNSSKHEKETL